MSLTRIPFIALALAATTAQAQSVTPMTNVRMTIGNRSESVRLVSSDSVSFVVENMRGERRTIARADVTSIARRSGAARGAKIAGSLSAAVGAGFGALLLYGLCETDDCGDDLLPAMFYGAAALGAIGAVGGATIGHISATWRPLDPNLSVKPLDPVGTCLMHPRFEIQSMRSAEVTRAPHTQLSAGAVCGNGTVIGVQLGTISSLSTMTSEVIADPDYGQVTTVTSNGREVGYRGVFVEHPLTTGPVRLAAVASLGEYTTERMTFQYSRVERDYSDYRLFNERYPITSGVTSLREHGAMLGARAAWALSPLVSAGLDVRLHRPGSSDQTFATGLSLSFRP